jgi:hypothetical protein
VDIGEAIVQIRKDALNGNPEAIKALLKIQKALASAESVRMII